MFGYIKYLFLLMIVCFASSQIVTSGKCPDVPVVSDFQVEKVAGKWYSFKYFESPYAPDTKCAEERHYLEDGKWKGEFQFINSTTKEKVVTTFFINPIYNNSYAEFTSTAHMNGELLKVNVKIIDIDYDNYVILWSCTETDGNSVAVAAIKTRSRTVSDQILNKIVKIFDEHDLGAEHLKSVDQTDCS